MPINHNYSIGIEKESSAGTRPSHIPRPSRARSVRGVEVVTSFNEKDDRTAASSVLISSYSKIPRRVIKVPDPTARSDSGKTTTSNDPPTYHGDDRSIGRMKCRVRTRTVVQMARQPMKTARRSSSEARRAQPIRRAGPPVASQRTVPELTSPRPAKSSRRRAVSGDVDCTTKQGGVIHRSVVTESEPSSDVVRPRVTSNDDVKDHNATMAPSTDDRQNDTTLDEDHHHHSPDEDSSAAAAASLDGQVSSSPSAVDSLEVGVILDRTAQPTRRRSEDRLVLPDGSVVHRVNTVESLTTQCGGTMKRLTVEEHTVSDDSVRTRTHVQADSLSPSGDELIRTYIKETVTCTSGWFVEDSELDERRSNTNVNGFHNHHQKEEISNSPEGAFTRRCVTTDSVVMVSGERSELRSTQEKSVEQSGSTTRDVSEHVVVSADGETTRRTNVVVDGTKGEDGEWSRCSTTEMVMSATSGPTSYLVDEIETRTVTSGESTRRSLVQKIWLESSGVSARRDLEVTTTSPNGDVTKRVESLTKVDKGNGKTVTTERSVESFKTSHCG